MRKLISKKGLSFILVGTLAVIALIVFIRLVTIGFANATTWIIIMIYWCVLTIKNLNDLRKDDKDNVKYDV